MTLHNNHNSNNNSNSDSQAGSLSNVTNVNPNSTSNNENSNKKQRIQYYRTTNPPISSFWKMVDAVSIYAFCIFLPSLLGVCVRLYQDRFPLYYTSKNTMFSGFNNIAPTTTNMNPLQGEVLSNYNLDSTITISNNKINNNINNDNHYHNEQSSTTLQFPTLTSIVSITTHNISHHLTHILQKYLTPYLQSDAITDFQFTLFLCLLLTILRVLLVSYFVPRYLAPRRLAAFIRTKSTHLLSSSEYHFHHHHHHNTALHTSNTTTAISNNHSPTTNINDKNDPSETQETTLVKSTYQKLTTLYNTSTHAFRRSLGYESKSFYDTLDAVQISRLFSAPRYATAIFRFMFCFFSCIYAYYTFSHANFWPIWLGGRSSSNGGGFTKNCWSLAGGVALGRNSLLDSDFDHQNLKLRFFFLSQASYHLHSIGFHLLSMILLLYYGEKVQGGGEGANDSNTFYNTNNNNYGSGGYISLRSSMKSYFRPLTEHLCYLAAIFTSFIFSGSRRLGTIAIYTFEISSALLQILQICLNAPDSSILSKSKSIVLIHRCCVVPVFLYCRLFILPFVVQYSMAFESHVWIKQLEHALLPGWGMLIYLFFNGILMIAFGLNLVYFWRLLFHPAVAQHARKLRESRRVKVTR